MRAIPLPPSRHVSTCSAVYNPSSPGMVRQIFRFEILPLVLYVGLSAHFMAENCISRFKTWFGCLSGYRRKGYSVTLVISQHVDTKEYERVLSFSIRCRRYVCSPCLF